MAAFDRQKVFGSHDSVHLFFSHLQNRAL